MIDVYIKLEEDKMLQNQYKITYRCPNCGTKFQKGVQKGLIAKGQAGECPTCGVVDGKAGVGNFEVLKYNHRDDMQRQILME